MKLVGLLVACGCVYSLAQDTAADPKAAAIIEALQSSQLTSQPIISQIRHLRKLDPVRFPDDLSAARIVAARDGAVKWWVWGLDKDVVSKEVWVSGSRFRVIVLTTVQGILVAAALENEKDFLVATIVVANLLNQPLDVLPNTISLYELAPQSQRIDSVPHAKVAAKTSKAGAVEEFFLSMTAGSATTRVQTRNGDSFEVPDYQAREKASQRLEERAAEKKQRAVDVSSTALREQTLFEKQNVVGKLYFKRPKHRPQEMVLRFPLRGFTYEIPFDLPSK